MESDNLQGEGDTRPAALAAHPLAELPRPCHVCHRGRVLAADDPATTTAGPIDGGTGLSLARPGRFQVVCFGDTF